MDPRALLLTGLGLLVVAGGAEAFVRGASRLAAAAGLPPLVIGLTLVSFGTSAPELAVGVRASLDGLPELALGNVVGSNIFNVLFILGISALLRPVSVGRQVVRREIPLMIGVSVALVLAAVDGGVGRIEGVVLLLGVGAYTTWAILAGSREEGAEEPGAAPPEAPPEEPGPWWVQLAWMAGGLAGLVAGSAWLVDGASRVALAAGVDHVVVGLTVVAVGTSLPEAATSVVAALRGERDIAVGNVIGSNVFNVLAIVGASAAVAGDGLPVSPGMLRFDLPVMLAVAVACLPIFLTGWTISRWEGALFLGYYGAYMTVLVLDARGHAALETFTRAMWLFVIPLTLFGVGCVLLRALGYDGPDPRDPSGGG